MIRYCPEPSVTTERVPSMSAGLEASTVTPGRTPPDPSLTTPVKAPCANAAAGNINANARLRSRILLANGIVALHSTLKLVREPHSRMRIPSRQPPCFGETYQSVLGGRVGFELVKSAGDR